MADKTPNGWVERVVIWLTGQPFNNALLILILGCICYGGWYAMETAIPSHLRSIQSGYETINTQHREERLITEESHTKQVERIVTGFEKAIDRDMQLMEHMLLEQQRDRRSGQPGLLGEKQ